MNLPDYITHHFSDGLYAKEASIPADNSIQIIDGKLEDIENFDQLGLEHWQDFNTKLPSFNKEFLNNLHVVIAKNLNETIGYVFYLIYKSPYHNEFWCQIDMFYLKKSYRNNGIGKKMFDYVEQIAKENDCKRLLASYNLKQSLELFYEKIGFNATHVAVAKEI
jgi:GNAT superfamily N-acetyltransferase